MRSSGVAEMSREPLNLANEFEVSHYTSPITGKTHLIIRRRHDITRSPRLKFYRHCMHNEMEGRHFRGHGAREDSILVRQAFTRAAHHCAIEDKSYPSDAHHG